ncbi:MFS transporter [Paenibacillus jilunlii]|uniref:MFS transporter n=1 Tax=Paenibacillus jilunlii TaxID=682956 RepID=A0A1G9FZS1_9BACL|nr:MFS transporter [Paenibacillus jilunlii]KWX71290.1 MFS transporter [Paenibacillus jilunlii]SDK93855.1 Predicted arabinose efflux permease, MFS family [Paenibacillus jilunlii]
MIKRSFYYLWGSQTISNIADIIYILSITVLVFSSSNSLMQTTLIPLFRLSAQVVSGLVAPIILGRFRLTRILLFSQLGQFVIFTLLLLYLWNVPGQRSFLFIFVLVFGMSFLDGWTNPARNALVPRLATGEGLMRANGLMAVSDQVVRCAGWALSGIIVAWLGTLNTLVIASCCYLVAATVTSFIRDPLDHQESGSEAPASDTRPAAAESKGGYWKELGEGWRIIWHNRRIRSLMIVDSIDTIGGTSWLGVFILAYVTQVLHKDASWWGFMNASFFSGTILGGVLVVGLVKRLQKNSFLYMLGALFVYVLITVVFALNTIPAAALVLFAVSGLPVQMAGIIRRTLLQTSAPAAQLPKVMAGIDVLTNLAFGLSLLFLGWYADRFGMVQVYLLAAAMTTIAVLIGCFYRREFQEREQAGHPTVTDEGISS